LIHYSFEAVNPTDTRLLDYAMEVVPALRADGVWDRDQLSNLVSYLVWRHGSLLSVQNLLQELAQLHPSEPEWSFFLGEAFHRHGDWVRAEQAYLQALSIDPGYATAYLRLGLVSEVRCTGNDSACDTAAFEWYSQYYALAPDDVFALMRLVQLCEDTGCYDLELWREELRTHTDGRLFVANQLGVPVDTVRLGPNLVSNADFDRWDGVNPVGWNLDSYSGQNRDRGLYAAGEDSLLSELGTARIIALWERVVPEQARTYAEYIGEAHPYGDERYLISLRYASQDLDNLDLVYLGENTVAGEIRLAYAGVKDTNRQWSVKHILIDGASIPTPLTPLIRNWGQGQLWIDAFEIRPVVLQGETDR
jgi:tetratricopeptide (TPR) repeat protein